MMRFLKSVGKAAICQLLERQVRRLRARHDFKIVAVAGSVGKTSTKLAIARVLELAGQRVRFQAGNYNDRLTVPLVLFARPLPHLFNLLAWARILLANERVIRQPYQCDIAVLELGTDGPGQMAKFAYLAPDITVLTAIAAEHMEQFGTLDNVASEELGVFDFSRKVLASTDDIDTKLFDSRNYVGYGLEGRPDYQASSQAADLSGQKLSFKLLRGREFSAKIDLLGEQGAKAALAAVACADTLEVPLKNIEPALEQLQPLAGRMQVLRGVNSSTLIDDTYNASPLAVKAALDTLYEISASQRIAILGSMNELGETSAAEHKLIGDACKPDKLALVATIGEAAKRYIAPAAEAAGCTVKSFLSPYEAGEFVKTQLKPGAVVLAKGSQNGVFAEEALKPLLADPGDAGKLVRQSPYWLKIKQKQF